MFERFDAACKSSLLNCYNETIQRAIKNVLSEMDTLLQKKTIRIIVFPSEKGQLFKETMYCFSDRTNPYLSQ